jgi:CHASE2 domain-containing sensor protein/predicted Ser/Thr protein kinase
VAAKLARYSWLPGGLAAALVVAVGRFLAPESSHELETGLYDRVIRARASKPAKEVAIVAIDNESIERLGPWPWPQPVHAELVEKLMAAGAKVIAFTEPIDTPRSNAEIERVREALKLLEESELRHSPQAEQLRSLLSAAGGASQASTARLSRALAAHGNVVLPLALQASPTVVDAPNELARFTASGSIAYRLEQSAPFRVVQHPAREFMDSARALGHTFVQPDKDGIVRTDVAFTRVGSFAMPSLAMAIAARAADVDPGSLSMDSKGIVAFGDAAVTLSSALDAHPQYYGASGADAFPQYSYWRVLAGEIGANELRGKTVLIGATTTEALPIPIFATPASAAAPPVALVASTTASYLDGISYATSTLTQAIEWIAAAIAIAVAAFVLPSLGVGLGLVATGIVIAAFVVTEVGLLSTMQTWARLVLPAVAVAAGFGLYLVGELIRRANVKNDRNRDSAANLRNLGLTFQRQGQLDLAFETYRRAPLDNATMDLLYNLGLDFERRRQTQKAAAVYSYIASRDPNFRDLRARRLRLREEAAMRSGPVTRTAATKPEPPRAAVEDYEPSFFAPQPSPGSRRTLGRYEIEREIGKGAMGVVYLGRDPKINRVVAIKAISLADEFEEEDLEEARARFFREAEMAGRLNHPAIVTVYDAGEDQGLAYIAMEYLRGQHLSHYADPARLLPPKTVMLLVARVADALHYAHRQNVVHRDIKPANIMFNPDTDELKITDFGIARLTDTSRTKTGIVLGTPSFMSPEQLEGRPLDGRSDQFALGVSLYQLLCGQLPFRAESMPRLMQKIATEPHTPIRVVRPELPECIERIIDRALAKNADDRYATCGELGLALRECAGAERRQSSRSEHEWLLP